MPRLPALDEPLASACDPSRQFINYRRDYSFKIEGADESNYPKALDNLVRLRLIKFVDERPLFVFQEWEDKVKNDSQRLFEEALQTEPYKAWAEGIPGAGAHVHRKGIDLTDLGNAFVNICMKGLK